MPDRIIVTSGMLCRKRNAHAGISSSGRSALSSFSYASGSLASLPPRNGSMTQTGIPHSRSSWTFALPSWNVQSR